MLFRFLFVPLWRLINFKCLTAELLVKVVSRFSLYKSTYFQLINHIYFVKR